MTRWRKLVERPILGWISYQMSANSLMSLKYTMLGNTGRCNIAPNHRYYGRKAVATEINRNLDETSTSNRENVSRVSRAVIREAQAALLDYLHSTRSFQFMDAEHISRNSPNFLRKLLGKVENEPNTTRSVSRFFRYHPVNEFEPFFESIGLDASEFIPLLPRDLMFLSDDVNMLENYHVLCDYGIPRNRIGKIYKEATEVFRYDYGVLQSKLQAYEGLGLSQSTVAMVVCSSPYLLFGDVNEDFRQVLGILNCLGFECDWFQGHLLVENSYNWRQIFELLCMLSDLGCSKEQLGSLISQHPELLFERTGSRTFSVIGFLVKFGSTKNDIYSVFLRFPQIQIDKFVWNLRNGFHFLVEIEMDVEDVGRIISSHAALLGSCSLKKTNSLLANLNIGKRRLSRAIKDNTDVLKNWVIGAKVKKFPSDGVEERSRIQKIEFLRNIGFAENSKEMAKALKVFRGKGLEIQERFDCLVKAGLDRNDVVRMVKVSPQILNQTKEVIEKKIDFLVNGLGYPITSLVAFPSYISYTIQRVKLRHSMYQWLNERGTATSGLALSTIMACTDKIFMRTYVNQHPKGPIVWQELKTRIYSV